MTKAELYERIVDRIVDPFEERETVFEPITLEEARVELQEIRIEDADAELEPEECIPAEVTPEILMDAWNCLVRKQQHDRWIENLADYLTEQELVVIHNNYFRKYPNNDPEVVPTSFLWNNYEFEFADRLAHKPDVIIMLLIGRNSANSFRDSDDYCWFDEKKMQLFSSNTPFADGILDATALATYAVEQSKECLRYIMQDMEDDDIRNVFGCEPEEVEKLW